MRVLHFSDIHVAAAWREVPPRKWLGKRAVGVANLLAGRGRRFRGLEHKLAALARFRERQQADLVLFTGDYTTFGLDAEFARARRAVQPLTEAPLGYVGVPGNHDLYLPDVLREGSFERHFGDTLDSDLPEHRVDGVWPLVRLVRSEVAVVAVNSARPNRPPWRSSGRVPPRQLEALGRVLRDSRLRERFVFVLVHYAARLADGRRDSPFHRLVNDDALLEACAALPRGAILSGHVHHPYVVRVPGVRPPLVCCGSTTMAGREALWIHEVDGASARATPGRWDGERYVLDPSAAVDLG